MRFACFAGHEKLLIRGFCALSFDLVGRVDQDGALREEPRSCEVVRALNLLDGVFCRFGPETVATVFDVDEIHALHKRWPILRAHLSY